MPQRTICYGRISHLSASQQVERHCPICPVRDGCQVSGASTETHRIVQPQTKENTVSTYSAETNRLLRNPQLMDRAKKDFREMLRRVSGEAAAMAVRLEDDELTATELHDTAVELESLADHLFRGSITLRGMSA